MPETTFSTDHNWLPLVMLVIPVVWAAGLLLPFEFLKTKKWTFLYSAITSTISLGFAAYLAFLFPWGTPETVAFYKNDLDWIDGFGLHFTYGIDSVSLWLVLLTAFLMPGVVVASLIEVDHDMRQFHFWLHILEAALIGTFIARDIVLFYVCFEFTLVPLYFLIGVFGHEQRWKAARTYFLYAFTGSMLTFAGVLYVGWYGSQNPALVDGAIGKWTFNIDELYAVGRAMPVADQCWVMAAMLAGFGVKTPLFPVHTWLPLAHTEAPTAGSVDLAGLVLKIGPYGLLRLAIPMLPAAAVIFAPWVAAAAVVGIVYAAIICRVQKDAKKLIAYSSVSHMGFCALGLFALDPGAIGATGAVVYMIAHGLATGGLFLCIGMLYDRFHTRELTRLSGLARIMPLWSCFFVLFAMASVGLPGLNGFVGEFLTLVGGFQSTVFHQGLAIIAATGVVFAAVYLLHIVRKLVFGPTDIPPDHPGYSDAHEHGLSPEHDHDLSIREFITLGPLAAACIIIGLAPFPMIRSIEPTVRDMLAPAMLVVEQNQAQDAAPETPETPEAPDAEPSIPPAQLVGEPEARESASARSPLPDLPRPEVALPEPPAGPLALGHEGGER
ncbi:MAG: NADH-quinone oxidoreductase subunit M [Planctomycetota bacterium]